VFFSASYYRIGSVALHVKPDGRGFDELWRSPQNPYERDPATGNYPTPVLEIHFTTPVLHDGLLYAFSGRNEPDARFCCVELRTGELKWERDEAWRHRSAKQPEVYGRGACVLADNELMVLGEGGLLGLFRPDLRRPDELARWQVPMLKFPCWAAPVLADGRLFLRSERQLVCVAMH